MKKRDRIGPYTLISPLGERASSRTWLASAGGGEQRVALKLADKDDAAGRVRILHEVDIAGAFDHPNIVRIYECGEANGVLWLASEFVPGPHTPLRLANFRQLLLALVHVHANGVIHSDLATSNLLLDEEGDLRLTNFARARRDGQGPAPFQGTPHFMPPEQIHGQALDVRADMFSAGVVLYQILTGQRPFEGSALEVMQQVMQETQPAPSSVAPGLGTSFDELIRKALARNKADRFGGAFEFLSAFDAACKRGVRPPN